MSKKIKVGIVGGAGYTAGELLRLLVNHPQTEIVFVHSKSNAGKYIHSVHTDLLGDTQLRFSDTISGDIDVLFLCVGHGEAKKFLESNKINGNVKLIDLSQDHRLEEANRRSEIVNRKWTYGLPELNYDRIKTSSSIANPGCFATCIQLALLPLAKEGLLKDEVHVSATTGSTGAGQSLSDTSHFSWRQNNMSSYKVFRHQHLAEIGQSLKQLQANYSQEINFVPHRGSFTRGILASLYTETDVSVEKAQEVFRAYYEKHPFVHVSDEAIDLKQVVNTNKCLLHLEKHGKKLVVTSVIDNLLKGASGQAVQNMNLMFGLDETTGLKLKASAF